MPGFCVVGFFLLLRSRIFRQLYRELSPVVGVRTHTVFYARMYTARSLTIELIRRALQRGVRNVLYGL